MWIVYTLKKKLFVLLLVKLCTLLYIRLTLGHRTVSPPHYHSTHTQSLIMEIWTAKPHLTTYAMIPCMPPGVAFHEKCRCLSWKGLWTIHKLWRISLPLSISNAKPFSVYFGLLNYWPGLFTRFQLCLSLCCVVLFALIDQPYCLFTRFRLCLVYYVYLWNQVKTLCPRLHHFLTHSWIVKDPAEI